MVRPLVDYEVDRPQLQALRGAQASGTNRPSSSSYPCIRERSVRTRAMQPSGCGTDKRIESLQGTAPCERDHGEGDHPTPSRTRQLSPSSPKVLRFRPWEDRTSRSQGAFSMPERDTRPRSGPFFVPGPRQGPFQLRGASARPPGIGGFAGPSPWAPRSIPESCCAFSYL